MKPKFDRDTILVSLLTISLVAIVATAFISLLYKGDVERYFSDRISDSATRKDIVYQTGDVRIYRFEDNNSYCYVTQSYTNSTLYCMEKRQ